ncbi:MAG: DUF1059 domain-containing protein [Cyclobacteriaceae bacterium]
MKTMTCNQLGGACDLEFHADTFDAIAEQSKNHGTEMYHAKEPAHMAAMGKMQELMQSPDAMKKWFDEKRAEFEALPENS